MAQLIQMRQRIKAIETIKKITHAMRLISMSTHTRLRGKESPLKKYQNDITNLFFDIHQQTPKWRHKLTHPERTQHSKTLIILAGSQKGLCGNFNSSLLTFFEKTMQKQNIRDAQIITVGKKANDFVKNGEFGKVIQTHTNMTSQTLATISHKIFEIIMNNEYTFYKVFIVCNALKSFFIQTPHIIQLVPFAPQETKPEIHEYHWEQPPTEILNDLLEQSVLAQLYYLLFQSLLAEQAARFLSMDNSTRNANNLLDTTKLQYNKLRQTKITQELTELTGSF